MLSVSGLYKEYVTENSRAVKAAQNVTFEVPRGKMFTLLGPSGCGKTTTLRSIAGLEKPDAGKIAVDGWTVFSSEESVYVPPNKRNFGMVFQSYAIWPHMTVFQNVAFPLKVGAKKYSKRQIEEEVSRVLHVVALDGFESRPATKLSGGQQQRLALARALVSQPPLLLLDEPLSNLDAKLRERMRFELKRLQQELNLTSVYVTHDQSEALALSHEVAVMAQGEVVQVGSPKDIYERPRNKFVADFVGTTNLINATVLEKNGTDDSYKVRVPFGIINVTAFEPVTEGKDVLISIRPEHIAVFGRKPAEPDAYEAVVDARVFLGDRQDLELRIGNAVIQARADTSFEIDAGGTVYVSFDPGRCNICLE